MTNLLSESLRRLLGTPRPAPGTATGARPARPEPTATPQRGPYEAEVIAVCAQKGGVGKTTTSVNLAAGLAMLAGKKVLLVDMDPQGHCALALHGEIPPRPGEPPKLSDVLVKKARDIHDTAFDTRIPGLRLCPSDKELGQAESILSGRIGKEFLLRKALERARTHAEVIVIDCPPNLGTLTLNALLAADWLLAPCDMSTLSVEGIGDIFETVETVRDTLGHHLSVLGVVRTRHDAKNKKVNEAVERTLEQWSRHLVMTRIPVNTALAQAQLAGTSIFSHDPSCRGAKAYAQVVKDVVGRLFRERDAE
jgi:chromosome partitioning protein